MVAALAEFKPFPPKRSMQKQSAAIHRTCLLGKIHFSASFSDSYHSKMISGSESIIKKDTT